MMHPSSDILLGLFAWYPENSPVQVAMNLTSQIHDHIARILINVSNAAPDTTYTLTVSVHALVYERTFIHCS
jgi:hypothetical protein